jgi:hypothetical protein
MALSFQRHFCTGDAMAHTTGELRERDEDDRAANVVTEMSDGTKPKQIAASPKTPNF